MSNLMFKNEKFIPAKTLSVGVDIAKRIHCAQAVSGNGEYLTKKPFFFRNSRKSFMEFLRRLEELKKSSGCDEVCVGMEPTGPYWKCFNGFLMENGVRTVTLSPYLVKKMKEVYSNNRSKTDPKDAGIIARMVSEGKYLNGAVLSDNQETLSHFTEYRETLITGKTALTNRIGSLLAEYFPEWENCISSLESKAFLAMLKEHPTPGDIIKSGEVNLTKLFQEKSHGKLGSERVLTILKEAAQSIGKQTGHKGYSFVIKNLVEELEDTIARIEEVDAEIHSCLEEMEEYKYLSSIKGLGDVTIASVISAIGDFTNYKNADCVLKMLGLQLFEISSGIHKGNRHISKRGASLPRSKLYMAALVTSKPGGIYHDKYTNMINKNKACPVALVAICCKLVRLMYALACQKRIYEVGHVWQSGKK